MHPKNGGKISISKFSPILVAITEQGRCFWPASSALKVTKSQNVLSISFFLLKMYEIILPNTSWWTVIVIILMKLGQNWKYPLIFNHLLLLDLTFAYLMKDLFIIPRPDNSSKQVTRRMLGFLFYPKYSLTYQICLNEFKKNPKTKMK